MKRTRVESRGPRDLSGATEPRLSLNPQPSTLNTATFLFAGGGSGGHLFPGIAVAEELTARDPRCTVLFVGSERGIERTVLAGTGWRHETLPIAPPALMKRNPSRFLIGFASSVRRSLRLIDALRPRTVIGLGGFASVPVALAARIRRVPVILLEQNVVPGRATSLLSRWAETVCVSFAETVPLLPTRSRCVVTGNPVRSRILRARRTPAAPVKTLLVLGGSQGAAGLNTMATAAVVALHESLAGWHVVHQTGDRDAERVRAAYAAAEIEAEVAPFCDDLPRRYAEATLTVSRAGATTLAELAAVGLPAVLVPYPRSVRDHQARNATHYAAAGAAVIVPEGPTGNERLIGVLRSLIDSPSRRAEMGEAMLHCARPSAASAVVSRLLPPAARARAA